MTLENIKVDNKNNTIDIWIKPTITGCTFINMIGLMIRAKLIRSIPSRFKVIFFLSKYLQNV